MKLNRLQHQQEIIVDMLKWECIYQDSDQEGFYMKDIEVGLSKPYENIHISDKILQIV